MSSDSPDFEAETYTEIRQELELEKRKLSTSVKKTAELYENTLKLQEKLDNFHKNKLCPTCMQYGCKVHCNTCGKETKWSHGDKVLLNKTTSKICILNMDGSEHRMCAVHGPFGIDDLDMEWIRMYRMKDAASIVGTRVWI